MPAIETIAAVGTGLGALATGLASLSFASMARNRYARAVTPDEPIVTIPWLDPAHARITVSVGLASIVIAVTSVLVGSIGAGGTGSWLWQGVGAIAVVTTIVGIVFVFSGVAARSEARDEESILERVRPTEPGRKVFGSRYSVTPGDDSDWGTPHLEVYDTGLVAPGPTGQQFVPWETVADVRLEPSQLVVDRHDRRPLRCSLSVLDDPEETAATLERFVTAPRTGPSLETREPDCQP